MKKLLAVSTTILLIASLLCSCASNTAITFPIDVPGVAPTPSLIDEFEMEKVGESSDGNFSYWRDMATDVLYIRFRDSSGYAGHGGLTIMLDPSTGLPLTYTRYMELYSGNLP